MTDFTLNTGVRTDFPHYWELCTGSCHSYTALREDYRKQLKRAHDELGFKYVRFHGLLDDDMCICVADRDAAGKQTGILYNFVNMDSIFDFLLGIGMKPFIELGFMPTVLASGTTTCFHYKGNVTPPADYGEWGKLIGLLAEHAAERYGYEEVRTWYFEVWNEPNLSYFFTGTQDEYFKLYDYAARAVKSVDSRFRVGGPATSCNSWIPDMIRHCRENDVPLDFISTHHYPTDDPLWRNGGISVEEFFKKIGGTLGAYERGVLRKMTEKAREEAGNLPLIYTEWNTSAMTRDSKHDESYASAMIAKTLADNDGLVQGYSYWTFTDIFEEGSQIPGAFHGGFGLQTYAGIAKPAYRLFQLFHGLGTKRIGISSGQSGGTVEALAAETESGYRIVVYNHTVPDAPIGTENVRLDISAVPGKKSLTLYRIDDAHANATTVWKRTGSPEYLKPSDVEKLNKASELVPEKIELSDFPEIQIPAYGVAALDIVCR